MVTQVYISSPSRFEIPYESHDHSKGLVPLVWVFQIELGRTPHRKALFERKDGTVDLQ